MTQPEAALGDALRALPAPAISPDFDARVLAALHGRRPWYKTLWPALRPALCGAAGSLAVTLLALHWTFSAPITFPAAPIAPPTLAAAPSRLPPLDTLLARPDLSAGTFAAWAALPPLPAPPDRPPPPRRRAERLRPAGLVV